MFATDCSEEQNLDVFKNGAHPLMGTDWLQMFIVEIFFKSNTLFDISKSEVKSKMFSGVILISWGCTKVIL